MTTKEGDPARREQDRQLATRYREQGDEGAREELVKRYMPLAQRLAMRYRHTEEPLEDLVQVANMALVKAIDGFDPERSNAFSSYAVPTILGELKRYFRDHGWSVHVPRDLQERATKVNRTLEELGKQLGRSPTVKEVAERLDVDLEEVLEAMQAAQAYDASSLDVERRSEEGDGRTVVETIGDEDPGYDVVEYGAAIEQALEGMPERERLMLHLRFVEDMTQAQIADRIGVSQMHVSRLLRRAVTQLRDSATAEEDSS